MKKMLCSVIVLSVALFSINSAAATMSAGIKGGLSLGTLTGKGVEDMDSASDVGMKPAFTGYGLLSADVTENFGVQFEIGYVSKGKIWKDPSENKNTMSTNFNYLEIPVLVKGMLPLGTITPMIYAGPTFGFMLSSNVKMHNESPSFDTTLTIDDSTRNFFEMGIAMGIGSAITAGPGAIIFDVRYTIGLTSLIKLTAEEESFGITEEDVATKTGTLGIMIGYQFPF